MSFKPDTDDLRGSPASIVVKSLMDIGLDVSCVEPNIQNHSNFFITSFDEAIKNSDVIAILVGHKEFKSEANKELLRNIKVMDFCGVLS